MASSVFIGSSSLYITTSSGKADVDGLMYTLQFLLEYSVQDACPAPLTTLLSIYATFFLVRSCILAL